jgi:hypothetical protein
MRTRDRKSVLIPVTSTLRSGWTEAADVRLTVENASWQGLGAGYGRLSARRMEVETAGRRSPLPYRTALWLPDDQGRVSAEAAQPIPFPAPALASG